MAPAIVPAPPPDGRPAPEPASKGQIHGKHHQAQRDHPEPEDGQEPDEASKNQNNAKRDPQRPRLRQTDLLSCEPNALSAHWQHALMCEGAAELIFDIDVNDLVEALLGSKANAFCSASIEAARPALDDAHDVRV